MKKIDMIIRGGHLYTMTGTGVGYQQASSLAVDSGRILAIAPDAEITRDYAAEQVIDARDKMILPGFIDAHIHARHAVLRGVAQDLRLESWMMEGMAPFEIHCGARDRAAGSRLAIAESIMNGVTTIGDDGPDMEEAILAIREMGARGHISVRIRDVELRAYRPQELYPFDAATGERSLSDCLRLYDRYNNDDGGRIRIHFGPQGADFVSQPLLMKVKELARQRGAKIHMHLQQGRREAGQMMMRYGQRTIPWLAQLDYFDSDFIGIHLADATDDEVRLVAASGASMVVCSNSIAIIRGEVPPALLFMEQGGRVALGTDQAPGNNCHNMFGEMKQTALLNKIKYHDPQLLPAWKALRMATIEGAQVLGIDDVAGSLEIGKDADVIIVSLRHPSMCPVYTYPLRNLIPNLVYSASGKEVDTVIVKGRVLMQERRPLTFDLEEIMDEAQRCAGILGARAAEQFLTLDGANAGYMRENKL